MHYFWCLVQSTANLRIQEKKHSFNALMLYYPTKVFTVLQPSHLIKVINLQQLAQKINNWFRCKVPPPSYAACIFILTVNKIGSSANLRKKYKVARPEMTCPQLFQLLTSLWWYFLGAKPIFTLYLCTANDKQWDVYSTIGLNPY